MNSTNKYCALLATLLGLGTAGVAATPPQAGELSGLAGRVFAVSAEIVFSLDPSSPVGLVFDNCYIFNEDGTWEDPLFPAPEATIPGTWVQHTERPMVEYTATIVDLAPELLLTQNGTVHPARGSGQQHITAYTTVFFYGDVIIDVVSRGRAVEECPFY